MAKPTRLFFLAHAQVFLLVHCPAHRVSATHSSFAKHSGPPAIAHRVHGIGVEKADRGLLGRSKGEAGLDQNAAPVVDGTACVMRASGEKVRLEPDNFVRR